MPIARHRGPARVMPPPLASCIMPTADRRALVPQAIALFLAQDYPTRELIVLDDGADPIGDLVPADPRLRYIRIAPGLTLGAKRNLACEVARGDVILHWDDDDWYAPDRISLQVAALVERDADISGITRVVFADITTRRAWHYAYPLRAAPWVCGATLCYRRAFWAANPFPDIDIGEDTAFVSKVAPGRLARLSRGDFFVARTHGANTTRPRRGPPLWTPADFAGVAALIGGYADPVPEHRRGGWPRRPATVDSIPDVPLVSCIMPTQGRAGFVEQAVRYFRRQDHPRRELVIVHHSPDDLPSGLNGADLRLVRTDQATIGGMRNAALLAACGDIVAHWDDDDWYGPARLSGQLAPIVAGAADITALTDTVFLELPTLSYWRVSPKLHRTMFVEDVSGGTIMYRRGIWDKCGPYPPVSLREDVALLDAVVRGGGRLARVPAPGHYVYVRHAAATWRFAIGSWPGPPGWRRMRTPKYMDADHAFYRRLGGLPA